MLKVDIDKAIELLSKYNVDHGAAGAAAVPIGRAIAAYRSMMRLRALAVRQTGYRSDGKGFASVLQDADPALISEFTPDAFDEALALAFVPQPVLRDAARFSLARPGDGQPEQFEWDPASVMGVTMHAINATLGYRYVVNVNQAAVVMRQVFTAAGVDARQHDSALGYMLGSIRGIAQSSRQMRTWRSAEASITFADTIIASRADRAIVAATIVMAGVMQAYNE